MQRRNMAPHHGKNKLNVLQVKKRSSSNIILDACSTYINILKLKLEAMKTECLSPAVNNNQNELPTKEVEVEKKTENGFHIRVNCQQKRRDNLLVSILEVFEEMGLEVLQASVSCNQHYSFCMEAIVEAQAHDQNTTTILDAQAVSRALEHKLEKKNTSTSEVIRM